MSVHFYLVRHGQSQGNLTHSFLGHTDLPLTELGRAQAEKASHYLATLSPDRIYASDLLRAYYTAVPTAEKLSLPIEKSENLREIFAGEWEGRSFSSLQVEFQEDYAVWCQNIGLSCPTGGESVENLYVRIHKELVRIAEENEGKTVMVFLHATPIRVLGAMSSGLGLEGMKDLPWTTNASLSHFLYENGSFSLVEYCRDDYLEDLTSTLPRNV